MNKKRGRPASYTAYSRDYNKVAKAMKKRGYTMAERKYTKMEWERIHYAETNDRKLAIQRGERKTIGNINRDLIKEQQWTYSSAQAKAQRQAWIIAHPDSKKSELPSIMDVRGGKKQAVDWNAISAREKELRTQGWGWARVHSTISSEFFGS